MGIARTVQRVSATELRDHFREYLNKAKGGNVILVENRRQEPKYIVDKEWFDSLLQDAKSITATVEILADRNLTERLLHLSTTIDEDLRAGRLHTLEEVLGQE